MPQTLSRVNPKNSKVVATCVRKTNKEKKRKKHFIRASMYLARKYKFGTLFYVSCWRQNRHFTWPSEPGQGLAVCMAWTVLSIGPPVPVIELCSQALYQLSKSWNINRLRHSQARHAHVTLLIVLSYCLIFLIQI